MNSLNCDFYILLIVSWIWWWLEGLLLASRCSWRWNRVALHKVNHLNVPHSFPLPDIHTHWGGVERYWSCERRLMTCHVYYLLLRATLIFYNNIIKNNRFLIHTLDHQLYSSDYAQTKCLISGFKCVTWK